MCSPELQYYADQTQAQVSNVYPTLPRNSIPTKPPPRTNSTKPGTPSRRRCRRGASSLLRRTIRPSLRCTRRCSKPTLHHLGRLYVVCPATKRRPYPGEEIEEMGGQETGRLLEGQLGAVHDHGHEEQGIRQVLRLECDDEQGNLTCRVVLGVRVCICEAQGREEHKCFQDKACGSLLDQVSRIFPTA